jgi:hypothetical protein
MASNSVVAVSSLLPKIDDSLALALFSRPPLTEERMPSALF